MYDEELRREIDSMDGDVTDARLRTLSWACERYDRHLPKENIVRYEDIVASRGKALTAVVPDARELDEPLEERNLNALYDREEMLRVGERLLQSEGAYWNFYTKESVEQLLDLIR